MGRDVHRIGVRKDIYGKIRAEVVAEARAYRRQLETGVLSDTGNQTLRQWEGYWLEHIQAQRVRPQTLAACRGYLQRWTCTTTVAGK